MTKWYRACVNYIHSVPEYNCALEQERFTEKAAIAAIHKLKRYYDEKHFVKDPDYMVRMDRLLSVIKDHETDEEMDQWKVWLKYFVTMGGGEGRCEIRRKQQGIYDGYHRFPAVSA